MSEIFTAQIKVRKHVSIPEVKGVRYDETKAAVEKDYDLGEMTVRASTIGGLHERVKKAIELIEDVEL